jgi:2,3-bisphosphoglycerate-independent phosphoglycerate mutase
MDRSFLINCSGGLSSLIRTAAGTHLMDVVSDGGVHGYIDHMIWRPRPKQAFLAIHAIAEQGHVAHRRPFHCRVGRNRDLPEIARCIHHDQGGTTMDRDNRWGTRA